MGAGDKFIKVGNPGSATTLAAPGYTIGDATITVVSTTNWPAGPAGCVFAIDIIGADGLRVDGTYNVYQGTVATATSITNVSHISGTGTNRNYPAGTTTRVYIIVASELQNRLVDGLIVEHNQDGTHGAVTATSVTASGTVQGATVISTGDIQHRSVSLETIRSEMEFDYVASGCVWSGDAYASTRNASMTAGVVYIGGKRLTVALVTARSFTASKDTYIDVDNTGTLVYTEVTNNAASPALAANSIRIGIIVTGASNIAAVGSVNQGQENKVLPIASSTPYATTDSLGNLICPRDPSRKILGLRQLRTAYTTDTAGSTNAITGLSAPIIVPAGRRIKCTLTVANGRTNNPAGAVTISIHEGAVSGATQLTFGASETGVADEGTPMIASVTYTPSSSNITISTGIKTTWSATLYAAALGGTSSSVTQLLIELA